ncbi:MAG: hypothetical protein FWE10_02500 [Rikenellaceae bacterium]|nr:hypothetical protein [Rikenellaceae bacterium]MCL2692745.1 hypothetical protein [Rikenellaceae bacterium]
MKNIFVKIALFAFLPLVIAGCTEEEVFRYNEATRVVFVSVGGDENNTFAKAYDFTSVYNPSILDSVEVRIQGMAISKDLTVKLDIEPVEGFASPDVVFISDPVIPANSYTAKLYFRINRPANGGVTFRGNIVIDYEASGLEPGIMERSKFTITADDSFIYEWGTDKYLKITLDTYNEWLAPLIGAPSSIKVRFMVGNDATLRRWYPNGLPDYVADVRRGGVWPSYVIGDLEDALFRYNRDNPGNPLTDENGNPVVFRP